MSQEQLGEMAKFESTLLTYVKEFKGTWRNETPHHTTKNWSFEHNGVNYIVQRTVRNFTDETSYTLTKEFGRTIYYGISKQDLLAHVAEVLRGSL